MATNVIDSLFGPSPWQVQQAQNAAANQYAAQIANMNNIQQAKMGIGQGAAQLAAGTAGMFGLVNPDKQQAEMRQAVMGAGGDLSTAAGLKAKAAQFAQMGDNATAMRLLMAARSMESEEAKQKSDAALAYKNLALAEKALRENPNLAVTEVGVKGKPGYLQRVLFDKTNPQSPYQEIGEPYLSAAAAKQTFHVNTGGGESKQPLAYVDSDGTVKWGTMSEARGKTPAAYDSTTGRLVAAGKAEGRSIGEVSGKATGALAGMDETIKETTRYVNELLRHPGFSSAVGATLLPGMRFVEGSKEAGFMARLDQLKGGAFLKAYETLKGGGQITEIEGKKATDALMRMDKSVSEAEFKAAAKDFLSAITVGMNKLKAQASLTKRNAPSQGGVDLMSAAQAELDRRKATQNGR